MPHFIFLLLIFGVYSHLEKKAPEIRRRLMEADNAKQTYVSLCKKLESCQKEIDHLKLQRTTLSENKKLSQHRISLLEKQLKHSNRQVCSLLRVQSEYQIKSFSSGVGLNSVLSLLALIIDINYYVL